MYFESTKCNSYPPTCWWRPKEERKHSLTSLSPTSNAVSAYGSSCGHKGPWDGHAHARFEPMVDCHCKAGILDGVASSPGPPISPARSAGLLVNEGPVEDLEGANGIASFFLLTLSVVHPVVRRPGFFLPFLSVLGIQGTYALGDCVDD